MKKLLLLTAISICASDKDKKNFHLKVPPKITTTPFSSMPPQTKTPNNSPVIKKTRVTVRLPDGTVIITEEIQKSKST